MAYSKVAFIAFNAFAVVLAQSLTNSTLYPARYPLHSNSTPFFQNTTGRTTNTLVEVLGVANDSLVRRQTSSDQPSGVCAPGSPCSNGACCSNKGVCSYQASSCAPENCISNCNATAPCGQGYNPSSLSCPLNVCCSQYGFCGTTDDFCGTGCQNGFGECGPPPTPSCNGGNSASARTIGYYESWASTRTCDICNPEDLDLTGLTHLNFAFAFFDPTSFQITPMDSNSASLYSRFTALKSYKASLQTWISVGGWSFNDDTNSPNTRTAFSDMVSNPWKRQTFIRSLTNFMVSYGFDGVDLDWESPAADDRGGILADTANYVSLLQEMRAAFGSNYGISATIPSSFWYMQHFDIKTMQESLDWFNFMSYDIHGTWDSSDKFTGPYIRPHTNLTEITDGLSLLWRAGVTPDKVVLGLGWYGRSFTLTSPDCDTPNGVCEFSAGGNPGQCTNSAGTLSNAEMFRIIAAGGTQQGFDQTAAVKWITWDHNQWAANNLCLSGTMIWSVDQDNTNGDSMSDLLGIGSGNGISESESQAIKNQMNNATLQNEVAASCYGTFCGDTCQDGYFGATQAKGQVAGVQRDSVCSGDDFQTLCCAPGTSMGTCAWEGWRGVGLPCSLACNDTEATIVARNSNNYANSSEEDLLIDQTCTGGYQAYCCSGFKPSTRANTGNLFLYGQGYLSKRDLIERSVSPGRATGGVVAGGLTYGICAAAIASLLATAPFTFGLSLLGIPKETALCIAAGIAVASQGFAAGSRGPSQPNPKPPPPKASPTTGVPVSTGKKTTIGQWPILDFGTVAQGPGSCTCVITYTCRYGNGWDEVCDNQRWAIDKLLGGRTSYNMNTGRATSRVYSSWSVQRRAEFRTLVQGKRSPQAAQCQVDEFPMGALIEAANNNPQACRLVNGKANGAQGNDFKNWKAAQWTPCSAFLSKVCKKSPPPVTWAFGPYDRNDPRGSAPRNGKHFIQAYGFDSQTVNSLCLASYSYTNGNRKRANMMVEDHGFRALINDPLFGGQYGWPMQNYKINPEPKGAATPTSVASAAWLKRDLSQLIVFNETDETKDGEEYHFEDLEGNDIDGMDCDILVDDYSGATAYLYPEYEASSTAVDVVDAIVTAVDASPTMPTATRAESIPAETRMCKKARSGASATIDVPIETAAASYTA